MIDIFLHPGGLSYEKGRGCSLEKLKRIPERYQGPVLWAWLEMFYTPKEVPILKQHLSSCHIFFWLSTLKGTRNLRCGPFEAENPKRLCKGPITLIRRSFACLSLDPVKEICLDSERHYFVQLRYLQII